MFVERTHYYAKPGKADEVRKTRARACDVRAALGLPRGSVFHKVEPDADGPDVTWQCAFASVEVHEQDLAARANSPDFEAVRKHMRRCYDRFERHFERCVD